MVSLLNKSVSQRAVRLVGVATAAMFLCAGGAIAGPGDSMNRMERVRQDVSIDTVTAVGGASVGYGNFKLGADREAAVEAGVIRNYAGSMTDVSQNVRIKTLTQINSKGSYGVIEQGYRQ